MGGKTLVAYYSFEGNTRLIAEAIAQELGADLQELKPVKDLKSKGFGKYVWGGRQVLTGKEPELMPLERNPESYDVIFLGSPVWVYTYAPAMRSFLNAHRFTGKRVGLFMCHGGGPREALEKFEAAIPGNSIIGKLDIEEPLAHDPGARKREAAEWARKSLEG